TRSRTHLAGRPRRGGRRPAAGRDSRATGPERTGTTRRAPPDRPPGRAGPAGSGRGRPPWPPLTHSEAGRPPGVRSRANRLRVFAPAAIIWHSPPEIL